MWTRRKNLGIHNKLPVRACKNCDVAAMAVRTLMFGEVFAP